jgi:hypothetical protein
MLRKMQRGEHRSFDGDLPVTKKSVAPEFDVALVTRIASLASNPALLVDQELEFGGRVWHTFQNT